MSSSETPGEHVPGLSPQQDSPGEHAPELPLRQDPLGEAPSAQARANPLKENPVVGWARAIALGIRDTAEDMLDEGRKGAAKARDEGWQRFDAKTKYRRRR